jgi:hypothetical protein
MSEGAELVRRSFEAMAAWDVLEPEGEEYRDVGGFVVVSGRCRSCCALLQFAASKALPEIAAAFTRKRH